MRVLLDDNVILDAMLQRVPWHHDADAILQADANGQVECAVTTLSLANIYYVSRKVLGAGAARAIIRTYLANLEIISVEKQTLLDADVQSGADFEDNILIAAAVFAGLDAIVTRDPNGFAHAPIPVLGTGRTLETPCGVGRVTADSSHAMKPYGP